MVLAGWGKSRQEIYLKGHEFTRAEKQIELPPALAAEGCSSSDSPEISTFSAACQTENQSAMFSVCGARLPPLNLH
jgi:hypothetical protein